MRKHVKEMTIRWPDPEVAMKGHGHVMNAFEGYKKYRRPVPERIDLLMFKYVIPTPNQECKIRFRAAQLGGEVISEVSEIIEVRIKGDGRAYAKTMPDKYEPAHFLAAVKEVLDDPTSFPGSMYEYEGDMIRMGSLRYKNFLYHGLKCVTCGIEGKYFLKQKSHADEQEYHMNLYAVDMSGNRVLMTRDHIMPKAKGGPNVLENLQPMCSPCNGKKADKLPENFVPETI